MNDFEFLSKSHVIYIDMAPHSGYIDLPHLITAKREESGAWEVAIYRLENGSKTTAMPPTAMSIMKHSGAHTCLRGGDWGITVSYNEDGGIQKITSNHYDGSDKDVVYLLG